MDYAPVVVFAYNRYEEITTVMNALRKNIGAVNTDIYVFSNAAIPCVTDDEENVRKVRETLQQFSGYFHSYQIICREKNEGANANMIDGIDSIVRKYGKVIVLEDDILTCPSFLPFMNQALLEYEERQEIFSICGYNPVVIDNKMWGDSFSYDAFRSWGWAIWRDRWDTFSWEEDVFRKIDLVKMHSEAPIYLTTIYEDIIYPTSEHIYLDYKLACKQAACRKHVIYSVKSLCDNIGLNKTGEHINCNENYFNENFEQDYYCTAFKLSKRKLTAETNPEYFFKFRWLGLELPNLKGWKGDREHVYMRMYYALSHILIRKTSIEEWFKRREIQNIVIYGWGEAGRLLYDLLEQTSIEVQCIIDHRQVSAKIPAYQEVPDEYNIDAVVISALKDFCIIEEKLYYQTKAKIISMEDIVYECFLWERNEKQEVLV